MKKTILFLLLIFFIVINIASGETLSGTSKGEYGEAMTGVVTYIYVFDLDESGGELTQIANAAPVSDTVSSSINGTWLVSALADSDPVLVITIYYGTYLGQTKHAGAVFMTPQ